MASFLKKYYALYMNLFTYPSIVEFTTFYEISTFVNNMVSIRPSGYISKMILAVHPEGVSFT